MKTITIPSDFSVLEGTVKLPASKSITNRLLMIRALEGNGFPIINCSEADDSKMLNQILEALASTGNRSGVIEIDTGNAGTVIRFLTAFLAFRPGSYIITGSVRMKQRPIGALVDALIQLGGSIEYLEKPGYPPILIKGKSPEGSSVCVDAGISSQFISALMLTGPFMPEGIRITLSGRIVSYPYIEMTRKLMEQCGASVQINGSEIKISPGRYAPYSQAVEADWSAAAFWYEAAALAKEVDIHLQGLNSNSVQGDSILPELFRDLGVYTSFTTQGIHLKKSKKRKSSFTYDFTHTPDIAQPVIVTCALLGIASEFTGLDGLRIKETDRLRAVILELEKIGVTPILTGSGINQKLLLPGGLLSVPDDPVFDSYGDHRMAMAFAPVAVGLGKVTIRDPEVVGKSYPGFWDDLRIAGFVIT